MHFASQSFWKAPALAEKYTLRRGARPARGAGHQGQAVMLSQRAQRQESKIRQTEHGHTGLTISPPDRGSVAPGNSKPSCSRMILRRSLPVSEGAVKQGFGRRLTTAADVLKASTKLSKAKSAHTCSIIIRGIGVGHRPPLSTGDYKAQMRPA